MKKINEQSIEELNIYCDTIRKKIIQTVSKNGGHLSSNVVQLSLLSQCIMYLIVQTIRLFLT